MKPLSIESEVGRVTLEQERKVIATFHKHFPQHQLIETNKKLDAVNDGIIFHRATGVITSIVETKCRGASLDDLQGWGWEWLVTWQKVERCAMIAREMRVFFTGFLYLTHSDLLLMVKIYDGANDKWLVRYRKQETETQRNNKGGKTIRMNAFIDMRSATRFKMPP